MASFGLAYFLIFALVGILIPYFPLFAEELGLSGTQIGLLIATGAVVRTIAPPLWGYTADRLAARRPLLVLAALATAALVAPLLSARSAAALALWFAAFHFSMSPFVPFLDAATWERILESGGDYGRVRLWGSIGFILASAGAGWIAERFTVTHALAGCAPLCVLLAFAATRLPKHRAALQERAKIRRLLPALASAQLWLLFLTAAIMQLSHGAFYAFFSIHLRRLGFDPVAAGVAWATGVGAEVALMYGSAALFGRIKPERVLVMAFGIAAARWWITAGWAALPPVLVAQTLHAFTFAGFHIAALQTLHRIVPSVLRTTAQGLYGAISFGLGGSLGMALSGAVADRFGTGGLFALSGAVAIVGLLPALALARRIEAFDSGSTDGQVKGYEGHEVRTPSKENREVDA